MKRREDKKKHEIHITIGPNLPTSPLSLKKIEEGKERMKKLSKEDLELINNR